MAIGSSGEALVEPLSADEAASLFKASFGGARRVLLAVSGGADSIAMLALAADWAGDAEPELFVATVDHGLRPEAAGEAESVAALCAGFGLDHATLAIHVTPGGGVEQRARDARYAALSERAASIGADAIATAHTLDDQAETVLMRLAAGSGPAGLAGMRGESRRGGVRHLRPFLQTPKARLVATLRARGLGWAEDAMNADPAFARARLRSARAVLAREGLTAERLAKLAARMARVEDALEQAADRAEQAFVSREGEIRRIAAEAADAPEEIRLRLLSRLLFPSAPVRLEKLERLAARIAAEPSGAATIAGMRVAWTAGGVVIRPAPPRRGGARGGGPL